MRDPSPLVSHVILVAALLEASPAVAALGGFLATVGLRMASVRWGIRAPDPHWLEDDA